MSGDLRFVHRDNFRYLSGLGRDYARDVDGVLILLDAATGGVSDYMTAMCSKGGHDVRLPMGNLLVEWDKENGDLKYGYQRFDSENMKEHLTEGVERYGNNNSHTVMLSIKEGNRRNLVVIPLGSIIKTMRSVVNQYQVYCHRFCNDENGVVLDGLSYIGVTKRGWQTRLTEHVRAARSGSKYRFHEALRRWGDAATTVSHSIIGCGLDERKAMSLEEQTVGFESLYPRGLNMIPGGYAGLKYLHRIGAVGKNERVSPDNTFSVINRFFDTASRKGKPNPLMSALWRDDSYAEKIICGPENRLKPDQIRNARFLSSLGKSDMDIVAEIGARNTLQVRRVLDGTTYGRIS